MKQGGRPRKRDPRTANGHKRRGVKARLRAQGNPCWICGNDIDYSLPAGHPDSFECDEFIPVSRYQLGNYASPQDAALDFDNLRAAHRKCNEWRGNRMPWEFAEQAKAPKPMPTSREW